MADPKQVEKELAPILESMRELRERIGDIEGHQCPDQDFVRCEDCEAVGILTREYDRKAIEWFPLVSAECLRLMAELEQVKAELVVRSQNLDSWKQRAESAIEELEQVKQERGELAQRLGKPRCLTCNSVRMTNCSHFDNCDGIWKYELEERAEVSDRLIAAAQRIIDECGYITDKRGDGMWMRVEQLKDALKPFSLREGK